MNKEKIIYIILLPIVLTLAIWWGIEQWKECKSYGLSNFYCIKHIG